MNADATPITAEVLPAPEGSGIQSVIKAPAPWQLRGDGFVATFWLPDQLDDAATFTPDSLKGRRSGKLGTMMYVNYESSNAGPYQELLFIPGQFDFKGKSHRSITKIYVSTWESVVNGNVNWGIPKEQADFQVDQQGGFTTVKVSQAGHVFAEFKFKEMGFKLPINTRYVPAGLRTLAQHRDGKTFFYTPSSKGHVKLGALVTSKFDQHYFPDLSQATVLGTARIPDFEMVFPVSEVVEGTD